MSDPLDIDHLLDDVVTLPSLPSTLARITELVDNPDTPLSEVGKVIAIDPSISMKTLRLVNSAYYGFRENVNSVEQAVVLLGMKVMRNLVLSATVFDTFKSGGEGFFRHSVACGTVMRILVHGKATVDDSQSTQDAFVYGLLHDVGKIILDQFLPDECARAAETARSEGIPWFEAERKIIGADHAELGARLAEKWKLSGEIVSAIAGHHDLAQCRAEKYEELAAKLAVADYICYSSGISAQDGVSFSVEEGVWEKAKVSSEDISSVMDQFFGALPQIDELVSLVA